MKNEITRRDAIKTGACLTGILFSGCGPGILSGRGDKPNIVLVTVDTARYDRMGFNGCLALTIDGSFESTTPYLDSIAKKGVVFDRNYSQSNFTPFSIASLLNSGFVNDNRFCLDSKEALCRPTLPERLRQYDYQTFGAVSVVLLSKKAGFDRGFDRGFDSYLGTEGYLRRGDETVGELIESLSSVRPKKPFFVYYHNFDPHTLDHSSVALSSDLTDTHYNSPDEFRLRFKTPGNFDDQDRNVIGLYGIDSFRGITQKQRQVLSDQYDGQILFADANIRILMDFLEEQRLFDWNRDLFVLTADHGEDLGERGRDCCFHESLSESVIHTPLLMAGAGLPENRKVDELTMNVDVPPTVLDVAGIETPENCRGQSLVGIIRRDSVKSHNYVFTQSRLLDAVAVVAANRIKYIHRQSCEDNELKEREDFYPSGNVDFFGGLPNRFRLSFPEELWEKRRQFPIEIFFSKFRGPILPDHRFTKGYDFGGECVSKDGTLTKDDFDSLSFEDGRIFKDITSHLFSEDLWNAIAAYGIVFEWGLRNGSNISETMRFSLNPSPNFKELISLEKDPGETKNLIQDTNHGRDLEFLVNISKDYLLSKLNIEDFLEGLSPEAKKMFESLGYL